jgi:pyruvate ferredoxin oxidoreductase delta subunit
LAKPESETTWRDLEKGLIVTEPGSTSIYKTGDWRSQRPVVDKNKCVKCGLCALYCPEGCVSQQPDGNFEANLYYCKGCGICRHECPVKAISMVEEKEEFH